MLGYVYCWLVAVFFGYGLYTCLELWCKDQEIKYEEEDEEEQ